MNSASFFSRRNSRSSWFDRRRRNRERERERQSEQHIPFLVINAAEEEPLEAHFSGEECSLRRRVPKRIQLPASPVEYRRPNEVTKKHNASIFLATRIPRSSTQLFHEELVPQGCLVNHVLCGQRARRCCMKAGQHPAQSSLYARQAARKWVAASSCIHQPPLLNSNLAQPPGTAQHFLARIWDAVKPLPGADKAPHQLLGRVILLPPPSGEESLTCGASTIDLRHKQQYIAKLQALSSNLKIQSNARRTVST